MPGPGAGRRYAEAAWQLAERDGTAEAWQRDLALAASLAADTGTSRALDNPSVPAAVRREALRKALGSRVSADALNLCLILLDRARFSVLPSVSAEYDALLRRSRGIVAATVTTPAPLEAGELAAVKARVEKLAGAPVELATATDPSLVGGLTVRIGDTLIDASVRGRLERLRGRLANPATPETA
jgi:F-type H+-transporting ATPase subunit delta